MRRFFIRSSFAVAVLVAAAQGQTRTDTPQRTILTTPPSVHSDAAPASPSAPPDAADSALEKYREMWRKMTPAQQKAFLDSGGYTPEQYERQLKPKGSGPAGASTPRNADTMMDSLNKSIRNLDTVRDANLGRVQSESCPPEVAARIADLKAKLQSYESGGSAPTPVSTRPVTNVTAADPLAIANEWYKPAAASMSSDRVAQQNRLLAEVLPSGTPVPRPQVSEQELARTKAELEQLSGACAAPVR